MRATGTQFQQLLFGAGLIAALGWTSVRASEINGLQLGTGPTGTRAELQLDAATEFKVISLANPDRLVVDLPGTRLDRSFKLPAAAGLVKSVRSGQPEPGTTRIVFDLTSPVAVLKPRMEPGANGTRLVLEWPGDFAGDPIAAVTLVKQAPTITEKADDAAAITRSANAPDQIAAAAATSRLIANLPSARPDPVATQPTRPVPASPQPTIVLSVPPPATASVAVQEPPRAQPVETVPPDKGKTPRNMRSGIRPLVISIDAGHGGQDPGAVGPTGNREKNINLAIARELARQINDTPGLKAHLTRDTDVFIPLNRRAVLARQAGADMFISIHADAAENRSAKGSSVYVLSLKGASSQRARWLADKENASDLIGGGRLPQADNVLANVLVDLTQSGHMKASEDAGNHILSGLKRIGNNHKPNIERANFAVLRTSDMPSMLVETAFLSNPDEERRLIDPQFQRTVARAVLDGVNTYFTSQPPPGTLYATRASGNGVAAAGGGAP